MTKLAPGLQSQMTAAAISSARPSRPTRLVPHDLLHRIRLARQHGCDHRRFDDPRAHGVDADAPGCIFERSALRQPDHPVLRRVIDGSARKAHEPAERGAVDDRAAPVTSATLPSKDKFVGIALLIWPSIRSALAVG